jgi:Flp pilus assembly protein TadG
MSDTGDTMPTKRSPFRMFFEKFARELMGLRADQRGNIAVMMAFLLPVLVGFLGLGFEATEWYLQTRYMQNAADAAAIAAATNGSSSYVLEAKAVAAQYGFVDGTNNVQVRVPQPPLQPNTGLCPSSLYSDNCYQVQIISMVPLWLSQVVGYAGDGTVNGVKEKTLSSTALAQQNTIKQVICLLALSPTGTALLTNGAPNSNFAGCTVMSDSAGTCNGSNLNARYGLAHSTNSGCGNVQKSNIRPVPDPYAYMAPNIPQDTCSLPYPQEPGALPASNQWKGTLNITASNTLTGAGSGTTYPGLMFCGDVQLTGDTVIDTPDNTTGAVIVIENGQLDLNSYNLRTSNGSAVTIVFSGTSGSYSHIPSDTSSHGSTINIQAPSSSSTAPFPGMAIYQDPSLPAGPGVDLQYNGNRPTWDISGGVYLPNSNVQISGDVAQSSNGADCFVMVASTILINGTSNIYTQSPDGAGCKQGGTKMPTAYIPTRVQLVY